MQLIFEEIDYQVTELGDISLRRRSEPRLDNLLVYEVKLGEEFLMSSLFVEAEQALSNLSLAKLTQNSHLQDLDVIVGGLGLGYTAVAALEYESVARLRTIDVMAPVISWHQQGVLPVGDRLSRDARSELILGDFFEIAIDNKRGFLEGDATELVDKRVHAVLLDIDHSPSHWLNGANSQFYTEQSLRKMAAKILPGGVFGLWSNELPEDDFVALLGCVFREVESHVVTFDNPYSGGTSTNSVYIASVC